MLSALDSLSIYREIVTHANLSLMTKLTEYPSPAKREALIEAQRRNAEERVLKNSSIPRN